MLINFTIWTIILVLLYDYFKYVYVEYGLYKFLCMYTHKYNFLKHARKRFCSIPCALGKWSCMLPTSGSTSVYLMPPLLDLLYCWKMWHAVGRPCFFPPSWPADDLVKYKKRKCLYNSKRNGTDVCLHESERQWERQKERHTRSCSWL